MMCVTPLRVLGIVGLAILFALPSQSMAQGNASAKSGDAWAADSMDWPNWRGPELNGVSRETGLIEKWSPKGENLLWKRDDLGGRSTPICMRGRLYTIVRDNPDTEIEGEKVVCLDAASGKTLWENKFNVFLSDVPDTRVGWSSVVGDPQTGNVFALGVCGYFQCINGETGATLWTHSLSEEHGILSAFGGRTAFPVISGNLVFVSSVFVEWGDKAQPAQRILVFDKRNGQPIWFGDTRLRPEDVSYSTPIPSVIQGESTLVLASGDGAVYGFQTRTGKQLWHYVASPRGMQATPLVEQTRVFMGQAEENRDDRTMGAFFAIDATKRGDITKTGELWRIKEIAIGKSSAIPVEGKVVVVDDGGNLLMVDPANGKMIPPNKRPMKLDTAVTASPVFADGKIYICTTNGIWYTLKPTDQGIRVIYKMRLSDGGDTLASPVISHGRIYQQQSNVLYCIGQKNREPQTAPRPEPSAEMPAEADVTPALVQVAPVDSLLQPGMAQTFQTRLYNSHGQYLRNANAGEVKFTIAGVGKIDPDGRYTAPASGPAAPAIVTAEVGKIKGTTRIRVIPDLDWKFDFSDGQVPVTWIGARYRHIAIDFDVYNAAAAKSPLAGELYIYLMSNFINFNRPALKFDNNTPQQTWTELLRYLDLIEKATTPETAKQQLDPLLKILADAKVIEKWAWPNKKGIELTIPRGPRKIDGNGVMVKLSTIPRGARSQSWFGQTDLHDYTIQADVRGLSRHGRLPDIGVIGQRYTLQLMGDAQQLEIRTWHSHPLRMKKSHAVAWKPDVWYTMKFRAADEAGKVVLRGKIWPRGEKEPAAWTVEVTDPSPNPNRVGSPGVSGDAKNAEIFYDNILVTRNAKEREVNAR
jgi:outer membrane protein assembly factor BamB